jgi:solute carrier family 6 amino acid transporter-like protein 5/7/9/14
MGYGMITIPTIINFYYTVIMAYSFLFLFLGFTATLPWSTCDHDYNTQNCHSITEERDNCNMTAAEVFYNQECLNHTFFCEKFEYSVKPGSEGSYLCYNVTTDVEIPVRLAYPRTSASEEFWYRRVLGLNVIGVEETDENGTTTKWDSQLDTELNSWSKWGSPRWDLIGCLALCWTLICVSLIKGIQSYGKVVYFTTLFPYVVLTIMVGYVATLDGFAEGMEFYFVPKWEKLGDIEVWNAAAGQIFFSLGVAVGSQLLLSSYNGFNANAHRDALFIALGNSATSLYAGVVVFGVVGFIATTKGLAIDDVIKAGPGLAFVVYPEAVAVMDVAPLFSFMFFFMLILLAISSVCGSWEAFVASLMDEFPKLRNQRIKVMVISCFVAFLAGIPICFDSGFLLFQLMDDRSSNAILLMAFVELITISWFYGTDRFYGNIMEMKMWIPSFMAVYWKTCWFLITPIFIGFITIFSWVQKAGDQFLGYEYPPAVQAMGWGLELVSISIVVVVAVITIIQNVRNGEDVSYLKPGPMMTPKSSWGPRSDRDIEPTDGNDNTAYVS